MKIEGIETAYYRLPLEAMGDAGHGAIDSEEIITVKLRAGGLRGAGGYFAHVRVGIMLLAVFLVWVSNWREVQKIRSTATPSSQTSETAPARNP